MQALSRRSAPLVLVALLAWAGCGTTTTLESGDPSGTPGGDAEGTAGDDAGGAGEAGAGDDARASSDARVDSSRGDATSVGAPSGTLDTSFGSHGCATFAHANDRRYQSNPFALALGGAGDIYVGGRTGTDALGGYQKGWFVRLTGSGGVAVDTTVDATDYLWSVAVTPAGSPTWLAEKNTGSGTAVVATAASGTPDTTFALDASLGSTWLTGARYQSTGDLLLLATPSIGDADRLVRVRATGAVDATFATQGTLLLRTSASAQAKGVAATYQGLGVAVDASDAIYVAGLVASSSGSSWMVARYTASGAPDTAFGDGGTLVVGRAPRITDPHYAGFVLGSSASASDLYLVGRYDDPNEVYGSLYVAHVTPAGVDTAFAGGAGHLTLSRAPDSLLASAAAVQSDGSLLVASRGDLSWYVTRVTRTGAVDATYAASGWFQGALDQPSGGAGTTSAPPVALAVAPNGGAIVVQNWQYDQNLYAEAQAIVCKLTP